MATNHAFHAGDRVTLSYPYVFVSKRFSATVLRVTPNGLHLQMEGENGSERYFLRRGQWRSEFGRAVIIETRPELGAQKV